MWPAYLGIFLISASSLSFEIALTRLFSVAQWYHFAFMAVSIALLGFGASGSFLSLVPGLARREGAWHLPGLGILFALSVVGSYLVINYIPFDSYRIAWERIQFLYMAAYYLSLVAPFFFSGLIVGSLLAAWPERAAAIYSFNLAGSALGCIVIVVALPLVGAERAVMSCAFLGAVAAGVIALQWRPGGLWGPFFSFLYPVLILALLSCIFRIPPALEMRLSPYKGLISVLRFPQSQVIFSRWNAFSRVDVVESESIHSAPGLSLAYPGSPPAQKGLFIDGENLSPLAETSPAEKMDFADYLPVVLPYRLRPGARALLIETKGGLDVLVALRNGAGSVVAVESNPLVIEAATSLAASSVYRGPKVKIVSEEGRNYVRRAEERFDLVCISLADTFRPVTSGAYSLSENYLYTRQALRDYLEILNEEGILSLSRWLQLPPSESLRAWGLAVSALEDKGLSPAERLVAIRSWSTSLILVKNEPFNEKEISAVKDFCQKMRFDLVYYPGMSPEEANRYNVLTEPVYYRTFSELLESQDRAGFYASYPFDVYPPDDDRPFFFHFFRWSQTPAIIRNFGRRWEPFGGSGYFVLVVLFLLALFASAVLILLPLVVSREKKGASHLTHRWRFFIYFALLGLGFLFVEVPLMPRFILFLGQPTYSFATVLFGLLLFSGLGSMVSPRLSLLWVLALLCGAILVYPLLLPAFFNAFLGQSLVVRVGVSLAGLAPLGFLMGIPFPGGLAIVKSKAPGLIPWVWAINGCASVLSSVLSMMLAVSFGFSWVLVAAALAYLGGLAAIAPFCLGRINLSFLSPPTSNF